MKADTGCLAWVTGWLMAPLAGDQGFGLKVIGLVWEMVSVRYPAGNWMLLFMFTVVLTCTGSWAKAVKYEVDVIITFILEMRTLRL